MIQRHLINEFFGMMPAAAAARIEPTTSAEKWEEAPLSHANPAKWHPFGIQRGSALGSPLCPIPHKLEV
jgi:hypothetical protein